MTRYTRAKGSKASNERLPNEPTPWHVMKQQLVDSFNEDQKTPPKVKSAKELLREKEESLGEKTWAEFEEIKLKKLNKPDLSHKQNESENKKKKKLNYATHSNSNEIKISREREEEKIVNLKTESDNNDDTNINNKQKVKNKKKQEIDNTAKNLLDDVNRTSNKLFISEDSKVSKKRKRETESVEISNKISKSVDKKLKNDSSQNANIEDKNTKSQQKLSKRQKRNMKNKINKDSQENSNMNDSNLKQDFNVSDNDWNTSVKFGKQNRTERQSNDVDPKNINEKYQPYPQKDNDRFARGLRNFTDNSDRFSRGPLQARKIVKRKPPKIRDDKEHKRKKPDMGPTKVIINGVEVEIVHFDGFPVQRHDAERLKELRQKMIMKGIPKSEIDAAMKLERRRAEKALARIRRNVCFHCRKSGHNLVDCPELANEQSGTGICFKCGSTEHTHFDCKVNKSSEYRYATCFICREQGHIAKQCPDNPKGVYPQGGACKICGDVTHLKKDCPDLAKEREESALTVDKITNNTELLGTETIEKEKNKESQSSKKIVKF